MIIIDFYCDYYDYCDFLSLLPSECRAARRRHHHCRRRQHAYMIIIIIIMTVITILIIHYLKVEQLVNVRPLFEPRPLKLRVSDLLLAVGDFNPLNVRRDQELDAHQRAIVDRTAAGVRMS